MSIDISKIDYPVKDHLKNSIVIPANHFLIILSDSIPWSDYAQIAIDDLYNGIKRSGRKLNLRLHIGAFVLQTLFRWTDRELEENLNFYAPARVFCGIADKVKSYDHSSYVKFRNRLSDETASEFNISLLKVATRKGFTGTQFMDFDSTVQEANIEYPADIRMMQSIYRKGVKILKGLSDAGSTKAKCLLDKFDLKQANKDFKSYFFAKKNAKGFELKVEIFSKAHKLSKKILKSVNDVKSILYAYELPWNYSKDLAQLTDVAPELLKQINYFIKTGTVADNKILSLHAKEVKCIAKGKAGKKYEFGRKFFIGRLPGNYAYTFTDREFALEDSKSLARGLKEYEKIFDASPDSISGDQGFWSRPNLNACKEKKIKEIGINPRGYKGWKIPEDKIEEIKTRRAKVEPIIGHLKKRGMGKSKMKSDQMTKLDGQRSALSLNLSRMARDLSEKQLKWAG
jgi:IS5 family transposase